MSDTKRQLSLQDGRSVVPTRRSPEPINRRRVAAISVVVVGLAAAWIWLLMAVVNVEAADPPHWSGAAVNIDCTTQCHTLHQAAGGGLTSAQENAALCQSCHNPADANAGNLAMNDSDKAVRGSGGMHHAWAALAVNTELNTQLPTDSQMRVRVKCSTDPCPDEATRAAEGQIVCSTCHNQHNSLQTNGGTPRISAAKKVIDSGGSGTLASSGTYSGSTGYWYWVQIVDISGGDKFCWATVGDTAGTIWSPAGCDPAAGPPVLTPNLPATGTVALGADGVQVTFGGSGFVVGERWEFNASWPFLRDELNDIGGTDSGGNIFCMNCHDPTAWQMIDAGTWNGGSVKSHPIGVTLPVDNFHAAPLESDGSAGDDGNPTNDLTLFGASNDQVQCLTCHGIHFVDSNTNTVDGPQ